MSIRTALPAIAAFALAAAASTFPGLAVIRYPVSVSLQATRAVSVADNHCSIKLVAQVTDNLGWPLSGCTFAWQTDPGGLTVNSTNYSTTDSVNAWATTSTSNELPGYSVTVTASKNGHSATSSEVILKFVDATYAATHFSAAAPYPDTSFTKATAFTGGTGTIHSEHACYFSDGPPTYLTPWNDDAWDGATHSALSRTVHQAVGTYFFMPPLPTSWVESATEPNSADPIPAIWHQIVTRITAPYTVMPPGYSVAPKISIATQVDQWLYDPTISLGSRVFCRVGNQTSGTLIFDTAAILREDDWYVDSYDDHQHRVSNASTLYCLPEYAGCSGSYVDVITDIYSYARLAYSGTTASYGSWLDIKPVQTVSVRHAHVLDQNPYDVPFRITTGSMLPEAVVGTPYSITLSTEGGTSPITWNVQSGQSLPPGLSLSEGTISGTPTQAGSYGTTIQAQDATVPAQDTSKAFTLSVIDV